MYRKDIKHTQGNVPNQSCREILERCKQNDSKVTPEVGERALWFEEVCREGSTPVTGLSHLCNEEFQVVLTVRVVGIWVGSI